MEFNHARSRNTIDEEPTSGDSVEENVFQRALCRSLSPSLGVFVLLFVWPVCAYQEHARTILPHLTALAGNEGADAWIGETMEIFDSATSRHMGEAIVCRPTRMGGFSWFTLQHAEHSIFIRGVGFVVRVLPVCMQTCAHGTVGRGSTFPH